MQEFATQEGYIFDKAKRVKESLKRLESFDVTVAKPTCIEDVCVVVQQSLRWPNMVKFLLKKSVIGEIYIAEGTHNVL